MTRQLFYMMALICIMIQPCPVHTDDSKDTTMFSPEAKLSQEDIITKALQYTGFDAVISDAKYVSTQLDYVRIVEDNTPFMHSMIVGDTIARVEFKNIPLGNEKRKILRNFIVFLDPHGGQLLKIESISDDVGTSDTLPEPSAEVAANVLDKRGTKLDAVPDIPPKVKLLEVLSKCPYDPASSKKIKALYINHSVHETKYENCWIIMLHGTERLMSFTRPDPDRIPIYFRNTMWCVISGETGDWLYTVTAPKDIEYIKSHNLGLFDTKEE